MAACATRGAVHRSASVFQSNSRLGLGPGSERVFDFHPALPFGEVNRSRINGQTEVAVIYVFAQNPPTVAPVAPGLTASAGSVIEAIGGGNSNARAWGYLTPQ